ncbi:MAG: exo-beta-N-acetylmuramidase NamZ domain-containing protein [Bacteroidales bacterium]
MTVLLGSDRLLESGLLEGHRVGLVSNPASIDARFEHTADRLAARRDLTLGALFGPQHGFNADVQDNMIETGHGRDERRRVPVYSLYSETREPTGEMLAGLDDLVVDLQDVGARIYTFIYTMANCLRAAARHHVHVIVCDRPNPIAGCAVEGPMLQPGYESFVGQFPIPMQHGMTIGELARLFNEHFGIGARLTVMPMEGWRRPMYWDETGLPWVIPSPNMPTLDTAIVYPGMVLFEGTALSEGRGTTRPFEISGAPWVDARLASERLNGLRLPGAWFRPVGFEPTFHKFAHQACGGCQIHVTNRRAFQPVVAGVAVMAEYHRQNPERFAWRQPPYEYEHTKMPIDILAGSDALRRQIESDTPAREIAESWEAGVREFMQIRARYLLYE